MKIKVTKEEIGQPHEGIEIRIKGLKGDPEEESPGTSVFIEYYEGKVQLHWWTEGGQDCHTAILT